MLFAYVLKERIELDFIQPGDLAETLADSLDIGGIVNRLTDNDRTASRNAPYIFEKIGDEVAEKLVEIYKVEKETFDNNSFELVVEAAKDTLNRYSVPLLLETNFDPVRFRNELSKKPPKFPAFSSKQMEFYSQLLNAAALYVFAVADQTPNFTRDTTARLLQNESELLNDMRKALTNQEHLLSQTFGRQMTTDAQLFEAEYRSQLVSALDKLRLFGINNIDGARQPLTIAFVKMKMILEDFGEEQDKLKPRQLNFFDLNREENIDVERMFSTHTFSSGCKGGFENHFTQVGSSAVSSPLTDLKVDSWQGKIPFFVQLRDYAKQALPTIAELPMSLKATEIELLEGSVPTNWSTKQIRAKRTIIFLDGLDETNEPKRQEALAWVEGYCPCIQRLSLLSLVDLAQLISKRCSLNSSV